MSTPAAFGTYVFHMRTPAEISGEALAMRIPVVAPEAHAERCARLICFLTTARIVADRRAEQGPEDLDLAA